MNKFENLIRKKNKSKIVCLTAYSKNIALILDKHCDMILVGDSLGSVLYNYKSTRSVKLDTMIEHSKSVKMGVKKSVMVVDMPSNTYRNNQEALQNAKKISMSTLMEDEKDGVYLTPAHVHKALRKYLGIIDKPESEKFSFPLIEDIAFFG
jgi:ketopantoate hydroxymethyltransferase